MGNLGGQSRTYSARYGARDPLLASWPRLLAYMVWRAIITALRPVLFLGLLMAAGALLASAARQWPQAYEPGPPLSVQLETAFQNAGPDGANRRALWIERVEAALAPTFQSAPDLPLAESYLDAAISIEGREALALERLARDRRTGSIEAELRAHTAAQRAEALNDAVEALLSAGVEAGYQPATLILAPEPMRQRLDRARRLYGPALGASELWFADPGGQALALASLPGVQPGAPTLYGDVRDVLVQACALAQASGRSVSQCRVGFLPKPAADPILAALSLAVFSADEGDVSGARLIKTGYAAGLLDAYGAEQLAFGPDRVLGREALLAAVMPVIAEAGEAWTQPVRYAAPLRTAALEAARAGRVDQDQRSRAFAAMAALRRDVGSLTAMRLSTSVSSADDAERLALLSELAGRRLLALSDLDPDQLVQLTQVPDARRRPGFSDWPQRARLQALLGGGLIVMAVLVLLASMVRGYLRRRGGGPGGLERLDAAVTRLILGKNF